MNKLSISRVYAPLRVCADICFYLYAVSLFSFTVLYTASNERGVYGVVTNLIAPWSLQLTLFVACCFAVGFVIIRIKSSALRLILSLIPGLTFLMSPFQPQILIHVAAWVYYIVYMTIGNFEVYLDVYRKRARIMLILALVLTFCLIIFHFGNDMWYSMKLFGGEISGLCFFILTVLSLRGMRLGEGTPGTMRAVDSAYVIALPVLIMAVFFLMYALIPAFTGLFSILMRFFTWLYHVLFPEKQIANVYHPSEEDVNKTIKEHSVFLPSGGDQSPDKEMMSGEDPHISMPENLSLYIILALIAIAIVFIAVKLAKGKVKNFERPKVVREKIEKIPPQKILKRKASEPAVQSAVRQVRRVYHSYLEYIRSLRIDIKPSHTSEEILDLSSGRIDAGENRTLRDIYIAARYGDPEAVTEEHVGAARRCLSAIESAKAGAAEGR